MFAADRVKLPVINYPTVLLLLKADPPPTPHVSSQAAVNQHSASTFGALRPLACVTGRRLCPPLPPEEARAPVAQLDERCSELLCCGL